MLLFSTEPDRSCHSSSRQPHRIVYLAMAVAAAVRDRRCGVFRHADSLGLSSSSRLRIFLRVRRVFLDFGSLPHKDVAASLHPPVAAEANYYGKDVAASQYACGSEWIEDIDGVQVSAVTPLSIRAHEMLFFHIFNVQVFFCRGMAPIVSVVRCFSAATESLVVVQGIGVTFRTESGVQPIYIVLAMRLYPRPVQQLLQMRWQQSA